MPIACSFKQHHGREICYSSCPTWDGSFSYVRVEKTGDLPPADPRMVDVAILDMNHGWPNLGHDSIVHAVRDATCDLREAMGAAGLSVRALSFDVRRSQAIPEGPGGRFALYLGTGGPGHLDPKRNDGVWPGSQGVDEDPRWEPRLFALFDEIMKHEQTALIAVCHTFGVMCRWSGVARPVLRGPEKGGKSSGILENVLTPQAQQHPWFAAFARELPDGRRLRIADNRLYDLVAVNGLHGVLPIGYETLGEGGPQGNAVTMLEFARDAGGIMPRVFAVNHHPEIVDRSRQMLILQQKLDRGEVSEAWYEERCRLLTETYPDENSDQRLAITSDYTFLGPIRFYLTRQVRERAEALGHPVTVHERGIARVAERHAARLAGAGAA